MDIVVHLEPSPPHSPQESLTLPLLGTPSQPVHVLLSPSHTSEKYENIYKISEGAFLTS